MDDKKIRKRERQKMKQTKEKENNRKGFIKKQCFLELNQFKDLRGFLTCGVTFLFLLSEWCGDTNDVERRCQNHTLVSFQWKIFVTSHHEENYHTIEETRGKTPENYHIINDDDE